jgi:hypothetical protein
MNDSMSNGWESRLEMLAADTAYPATPDIWPALRYELSRKQTSPPAARPRLRWATVLGALAIALGLALFASPTARAALYRVIQLGVVRIFLEPSTATPSPSAAPGATPSTTPTPILRPPLDLEGRTSLAEIRRVLGDDVRLPTYPLDWGEPDLAFLQSIGGPLAVLVWLDPMDPTRAELALHILGPKAEASKSAAEMIEEVQVDGEPALWLVGAHRLLLRSGEMEFRTLVTGNVLLWKVGEVTYRLETDRTLEEAILIAESLQ